MKDTASRVVVLVLLFIMIGWALTTVPVHHSYSFYAESDGSVIEYRFESDYKADAYAVAIETDGTYDLNHLVILRDADYYSLSPDSALDEAVHTITNHLENCSFDDVETSDSAGVLQTIADGDIRHTAIVIMTGAIPDVIYNGTYDCPIMDWLDSGGTIINMFGTLGKHISHGPDEDDCVEVEGFSELFTGIDDDSRFMDLNETDKNTLNTNHCMDEEFTDPLHISFNEYSFGINTLGMTQCINLGFTSDDGFSCTSIFKSHNGMVMNFGMECWKISYTSIQVATVIAAGLDYSAEVTDWEHSRTDCSGTLESNPGRCTHIYGYIGSSTPQYGLKVIF